MVDLSVMVGYILLPVFFFAFFCFVQIGKNTDADKFDRYKWFGPFAYFFPSVLNRKGKNYLGILALVVLFAAVMAIYSIR
jgi:hypothetical protein